MSANGSLYKYLRAILKLLIFLFILFLFLLGIELMSAAMKGLGRGFAENLLSTTSNPFVGLVIGIFATSLIQSSSTTTSIIVGLVASGGLSLTSAIPMVMGANIGTSVTNTIVSLGHISRPIEFKRAFAAATVHDFFNLLTVLILFPLELLTHWIEKMASFLAALFGVADGVYFLSPLKILIEPVINYFKEAISPPALLVIALILIFLSLYYLVKFLKTVIVGKIEVAIDSYIFKTAGTAFVSGILFTIFVQSSSVTTSLIIPLVGAGILTVEKIFPYVMGANIGTTVTAILAAIVTTNPIAITVAIAHLLFNVLGVIMVCLFFKKIPIRLADNLSVLAVKSKKNAVLYILGVFYIIPLLLIFLFR